MKVRVGIVSDDRDPDKRGRVKVAFNDILGDDAGNPEVHPEWVEPCFPFVGKDSTGWFSVPSVGTAVEVEFHTGDATLVEENWPRYRTCLYKDRKSIPLEFRENYPFRMGIKTPSGHLFLFDNKDDAERIQLKHKDGIELVITDTYMYLGSETNTDYVALWTAIKDLFNSHYHVTAWGNSSNPVVAGFTMGTEARAGKVKAAK